MKFKITDIEVKNILEMHSKMKKNILSEQANVVTKSELETQLQGFIDNGCVVNGTVVSMKSTNPQKKFAIKQESTKTPGNFRYYFIDFTYGGMEGGKFVISPTKWKCNQSQIDAKTALTTDTTRTKTEGDWKERKDIEDTVQNLENPKMYEKKVLNGVTLYRRLASSSIGGSLTPDQKAVIDKWVKLGGKLRKELDAEEAKTWTSRVVSPASEGYFSQDLVMYFPPSNVTGAGGTNVETMFKNAVTSQTPTSKKDCRDTIRAYYEAWKTKKRIEPNTFEAMKEKVMACANEFEGKWGGALSLIDDYVKTLRGGTGGPLSYGDDAKWRLK